MTAPQRDTLISTLLILVFTSPLYASDLSIEIPYGSHHTESYKDFTTNVNGNSTTWKNGEWNEDNIGIILNKAFNDDIDIKIGGYNNSHDRISVVLGISYHLLQSRWLDLDSNLGIASGYEKLIVPTGSLQLTIDDNVRFQIIPETKRNPNTIGFSYVFEL